MTVGRDATLLRLGTMSANDAAAYWLARHDAGAVGPSDPTFQAWLEQSPANRAAWERAQRLWAQIDDDDDDVLTAALRSAALSARPSMWAVTPHNLIAAGVALAILGLGLGGLLQRLDFDPDKPASRRVVASADPLISRGSADIATRAGERKTVTLSDGTKVVLDADTAIDVAFAADRRELRLLRGRAFFDVAPDANRRFSVEAGSGLITDIGTAFSVQVDGEGLKVVLAQGLVQISHTNGGVKRDYRLKPGQAFAALDHQDGTVGPAAPADLAWRAQVLEFSDTPLATVVERMNAQGDKTLVVTDPSLAALRIDGQFKVGDAARFCRTLSALYPVRAKPRADGALEIVWARRPTSKTPPPPR